MSFETAAQQAVYAALNGSISASVYDYAPDLPEGMPDENFPYVVIGDDTLAPWDADDMLGSEVTLTLHFWSRYDGWKEAKAIMGEAYDILHRGSLSAAGYRTVDCLWELSTTVPEAERIPPRRSTLQTDPYQGVDHGHHRL